MYSQFAPYRQSGASRRSGSRALFTRARMRFRVVPGISTLNGLGPLFCANIGRLSEIGRSRKASRRVIARSLSSLRRLVHSEPDGSRNSLAAQEARRSLLPKLLGL